MGETGVLIQLPAPLLEFGFDENDIQQRVTEWLVLSLFTEGRVSSGKAARLLSISRVEFLALLRARGIAYLNYTPEELKEELAAAHDIPAKKGT